jgi:type I restriction-modification system DNA methylase subunit
MSSELFYPVGTVTCIVVFEAHKPHRETNKKTWFGYWRDDGYIKTKNMGRIDLNHQWQDIKSRWLEAFHNNEVHPPLFFAVLDTKLIPFSVFFNLLSSKLTPYLTSNISCNSTILKIS